MRTISRLSRSPSLRFSFVPSLVSDIKCNISDSSRKVSHQPHKRREARKGGQRMNRRSREVGFIFIAAIRRDSTPGVVGPRGRQGPTSLGQSVAVVIINDATSNATSAFSPPPFLSSCLLPSPPRSLSSFPLTADSSLLPRFIPPSFRVPALVLRSTIVWELYRVYRIILFERLRWLKDACGNEESRSNVWLKWNNETRQLRQK